MRERQTPPYSRPHPVGGRGLPAVGVLLLAGTSAAAEPIRLGDDRFRAGGPVAELVFSADAGELTSWVSLDPGTVRRAVWDAATGRLLRTADEPAGPRVRRAPTSYPDGPRGVVIGPDGAAAVRDFAAGREVARLAGHHARVTAAAVSPDGKRLATASADGLIRVWDARSFRPLVEPEGHAGAVRAVGVSADGRLAISTGRDGTARVWDLVAGRELRVFPATGEGVATFTPDGAAVRVPEADRVVARDPVTGQEVVPATRPAADPLALPAWLLGQFGVCVAVSPDGRTVAVGTRSGAIDLYEVATGQVRRRLTDRPGGCHDLAFTPDGSKLLAAGADHAVLVWPVRLQDVSLPAELRRETSAARLWDRMTAGDAAAAYLAMARLAADPPAARAMARRRPASGVGAVRVAELLDAVGRR
jgi:WD40 repeat protein